MNRKARYRALQRQLLLLKAESYRQKIREMIFPFQEPLGLTLLAARWFFISKCYVTSSLWKVLLAIGLTARAWRKKSKG